LSERRAWARHARLFSVAGVVLVAGGLFAFLFHDAGSVVIATHGPSAVVAGDVATFNVTVQVPPGQRLPVAGTTLVLERADASPPTFLASVTCPTDASCDASQLRAFGPDAAAVHGLTRLDATAPTTGRLTVRVQGWGHSDATGYGQEVEAVRRLSATDLVDPALGAGYGLGYGDEKSPTTVSYSFALDTSGLAPGAYRLTFLVESGSRVMGEVSGPSTPLTIGPR